jgi:L-alanine-DL-glutamate epimerase-like enolase superfamily enzyme
MSTAESMMMSTAVPMQMQVEIERLRLRNPFRISGYTFTEVPVVVVTLESERARGRGEAAGVYYLKDTPEQIVETLEAHRRIIESGLTRAQLLELLPLGGARNALDCALWDLEAKHAGVPVWRLAGVESLVPKITTFTLSADGPPAVVSAAEALPHAKALKLKLDGDLQMDKERVRAVRRLRPDIWIWSSSRCRAGARPTSTDSRARFRSLPMRACRGSPTSAVCKAASRS